MRIVVTDCDHDSFEIERQAAADAGAELAFAQARTAEEIVAAASGADAILVQYGDITESVLERLPGLRVIGRYGVGVDSVDVDAATARGVAVCNVPDYGTEAVADHAIGLTLAVARAIPRLDRGLRAGRFDLAVVRPLHLIGGRTFGVVGVGRIGSATARRAAGLGYQVIGYDPAAPADASAFKGVTIVPLPELLSRAHVVSMHLPLTEQTRHLLDAQALSEMRSDAVVVNTARGGVIDTAALVQALREGTIAGAGIDVHEDEPVPTDHPLLEFDSVVMTPHLAWYSEQTYAELKQRTIENVIQVCSGRAPRDIVNPDVLTRAHAWRI